MKLIQMPSRPKPRKSLAELEAMFDRAIKLLPTAIVEFTAALKDAETEVN